MTDVGRRQRHQHQFLNVLDRDAAQRRFLAALRLEPLGAETVPLDQAWGRVLACDVIARTNVPAFDRSNFDGFAVRAEDTYGADELRPRRLRLLPQAIEAGAAPAEEVAPGTAAIIATGAMLPRGADAVVMVEHAECEQDEVLVRRAVAPGEGLAYAGTDIAAGETVLRRGEVLSSRETSVLAALGESHVAVWRRPRVGVLSTGNEIVPPGRPLQPGQVYDSNSRVLADAVREQGGEPVPLGLVPDQLDTLRRRVRRALAQCDVLLLSGGTSKGAGDLSYQAVAELEDPGVIAHGVALKPGKPLCLAAVRGKPVVVLPGFPTSAVFTFHEFVAPVIRRLAGRRDPPQDTVSARLAVPVASEIGRTEFLLVCLAPAEDRAAAGQTKWAAFPMGKGSGSVTTFARADGFVVVGRHEERLEAGQPVSVRLLNRDSPLADLTAIGSHCIGLDLLLGRLQQAGFSTKLLAVGSQGGVEAVRRGQCDVAGVHLLDPATGQYNRPFTPPNAVWVPGYRRMQGVVYRRGDPRFEGRTAAEAVAAVRDDPACRMINRNPGSGTRVLIDQLLEGARPPGYAVQPRSHHAVAAAVAQGRADWGVCVSWVARQAGLGFLPLTEEHYDFLIPRSRRERPAVAALLGLLRDRAVRDELARLELQCETEP